MDARARTAPVRSGGRLLERERELASLDELITEAAGGFAGIVLIEGPAGIGKTRLVVEARRLGEEAGMHVVAARGGELEREFPFGVVRQLFEADLAKNAARENALAGAAQAARAVFELDVEDPDLEPREDPSFASLHGLYWLTANLSAEVPLLLTVDDLHWCDRPSLRFLAYLARRLEGLAVLIVCSVRSAEPGVDVGLIGEIAEDPLVITVQPGPLTELAVHELTSERLGQDAASTFSRACHTATGGNPLLLHELLRTLQAEHVTPDASHVDLIAGLGPRAASRSVLLRLARLSPDAAAVAHATAVLGENTDVARVAALAGLSEPATGLAVMELMRSEILRAEPPLAFAHPLIGAAIYRDVPLGERELQHARAARLLEDAGAPVDEVAAHLLASPASSEAALVETLQSAARVALQKGAADSAVAYLARALVEPPSNEARPEILLELGRAEALTHGPAAVEHLREAHETLGEPVRRGVAAQALGRALLFTGHPAEGAAVARQAAADLPPEAEDLKNALEAFELIAISVFGAPQREMLPRLERWRTLPKGAGVGAKMLAAVAAQDWAARDGSTDECVELALEALAGGQLIASDNGLLAISAIFVLVLADRDEALDAWEVSLEDAHRRGSLFSIASINLWRGFTMYRRGELGEAEDLLHTAFEEFTPRGYGRQEAQIFCDAILADVLRERGDLRAARQVLERSSDAADGSEGDRYWLSSHLELLLAEGRFAEVIEASDDLARRYMHVLNPADSPWRSRKGLALDRLDRPEEALALAAEELELARRWGAPGTIGRSLRVLGTLERADGVGHLEEAVDVLEESPARLEHAKALVALGAAMRRGRRPKDSRAPLRRALELADICGARGLADEARSELYAAGARPRSTALSGVESLTASEQRVSALAADGSANREIAQELFITTKTVEVHLTNIYRKLDISSRKELPAALTRR